MLHHAATRCNTLQHTVDGIFQNTQETQGSFAWAQGSFRREREAREREARERDAQWKSIHHVRDRLFWGFGGRVDKNSSLAQRYGSFTGGETHNEHQSALYEDCLCVSLAAVSKIQNHVQQSFTQT